MSRIDFEKAVILAAGRGSRLYSVTHGSPKCLVSFGHQAILDFQIEALFRLGIRSLAIVVGCAKDQVISHVEQRHPEKLDHIEFITNTRFAETNNMYSLWLAREWLDQARFLCLNADVLCHPDMLPIGLEKEQDILLVIDREFREETTKVTIQDGRVTALSKSISRKEASGTFVGIAGFSSRGLRRLFETAESQFLAGQFNQFFNDVISQLSAEGAGVSFSETDGLPWAEVDDARDLAYARDEVYPRFKTAAPTAGLDGRRQLVGDLIDVTCPQTRRNGAPGGRIVS